MARVPISIPDHAVLNLSLHSALQRIFRYASKWDYVAYFFGVVAAIGAGVTMPLMTVLFGTYMFSIIGLMIVVSQI